MSSGWDQSAAAWIAHIGEHGDFGRAHVLDPVMLERVAAGRFTRALDVGCGEGRFCRMLAARNIPAVGIDPTEALIAQARNTDPVGDYQQARAESLPFPPETFDLVVSYLTLIDIADFRLALREMVRVLRPGGTLLIANLTGFVSCSSTGSVRDVDGRFLYYPVDRYLEEFPARVEFGGINVENWHRPLSAYMRALLGLGLTLTYFDEPAPRSGDAAVQARFRRAPWFMVMEWRAREDR